MFITLLYAHIVVSSSDVKFCVDVSAMKVGKKVQNEGTWVLVLNGMTINVSIVLYRA